MTKGAWAQLMRSASRAILLVLALVAPVSAQEQRIVIDPAKGGTISDADLDAMLLSVPKAEPTGEGPNDRQIQMNSAGNTGDRAGGGRPTQDRSNSAAAVRPDPAPGGVVIEVPVQFALDSAEVPAEFVPLLRRIGERMAQLASAVLVIEGHTDASGSAAHNLRLSRERADAVRDWLVANHDIEPNRIQVVGRGESDLLPGRSPSDPANRRVEFRAGI